MKSDSKKTESTEFTASSVREASGVTYRQLNDWDSKGALPNQREQESGWRKFNPKQLFVILVCAEIRKQFGVSIEKIAWLQKCMLEEGTDHFSAAVRIMKHGLAVFILTNLSDQFEMDADLAIGELIEMGYCGNDELHSYVLLFVNPLVNKMLTALKTPMRFDISDKPYEALATAHNTLRVQNSAELAVLQLMRRRDSSKFSVTPKGYNAVVLEIEEEAGKDADLRKELEKDDFQTVTVNRQNGRNVRIFRKVVKKIAKDEFGPVVVRLRE